MNVFVDWMLRPFVDQTLLVEPPDDIPESRIVFFDRSELRVADILDLESQVDELVLVLTESILSHMHD